MFQREQHQHRLDCWRRRSSGCSRRIGRRKSNISTSTSTAVESNGAFTGWELGNNHHPQINVVRAGVNYLFNFASPAPVVAKY